MVTHRNDDVDMSYVYIRCFPEGVPVHFAINYNINFIFKYDENIVQCTLSIKTTGSKLQEKVLFNVILTELYHMKTYTTNIYYLI